MSTDAHVPLFRDGDKVRVVREDSRRFRGSGDEWPIDTMLTLMYFDPADDSWRAHTQGDALGHDSNWIGQEDIALADDGDELEREARQLFGLEPTPHCKTCTCHVGDHA